MAQGCQCEDEAEPVNVKGGCKSQREASRGRRRGELRTSQSGKGGEEPKRSRRHLFLLPRRPPDMVHLVRPSCSPPLILLLDTFHLPLSHCKGPVPLPATRTCCTTQLHLTPTAARLRLETCILDSCRDVFVTATFAGTGFVMLACALAGSIEEP